MTSPKPLFLYEEIMLLALRNEKGTIVTCFSEYAVAGAILAELSLERRISFETTGKRWVEVADGSPMGDPLIDECLQKLAAAKRRASLQTWVPRLAGIKDLKHKVARQLCDRGILRAEQNKVLFVFTRQDYPEVNPVPEKRIVDRVRAAVFSDDARLDPRTVVLISLAHSAGLLSETFGRKAVGARRKRIEQIVNGELTGKATREVITACRMAVMVATTTATMTATIAATSH
jgi:Golgi phosphoprotein 3